MAQEDKCDEQEKKFHMVFYRMSDMVKKIYGDYKKREILLSLHLRLQVLVLLPLRILITVNILTIKPLLRNHY
jgi:hypothetical protein